MIQELFGENTHTLLTQNQNLPISRALEPSPSPSPSSSITTTATATTTTTATTTSTTTSDHQKLRCPRCDSSHTKFCYYNNYNLTQPRHFCKTCRRYWTKGGALRNVPIGGGCRKTKGGATVATAIGKPISATGKLKATSFINGFELEPNYHNPIVWSHPPQTSHLLSLFRPTQNPNPNPNPNFASNSVTHIKDQSFMVGSNMGSVGFESLGQTSSLGLCSSLWRNNQDHHHQDHQNHHEQHDDQQGMRSSSSSSSISPANYYNNDQTAPLILGGNVVNTSSRSTSSAILDSAPVLAGGEFGLWNQTQPWSDLAAANGAYP